MAEEKVMTVQKQEGNLVSRYNKALGTIAGGVVGLLATSDVDVYRYVSPEMIDAMIVVVASVLGTYFAPGNKNKE